MSAFTVPVVGWALDSSSDVPSVLRPSGRCLIPHQSFFCSSHLFRWTNNPQDSCIIPVPTEELEPWMPSEKPLKILGTASFGTATAPAKQELPIYLLLKMLKVDHWQKWITDNWPVCMQSSLAQRQWLIIKDPPLSYFEWTFWNFKKLLPSTSKAFKFSALYLIWRISNTNIELVKIWVRFLHFSLHGPAVPSR